MADKHHAIYASEAERYDRLVSCEDAAGHLAQAIRAQADRPQVKVAVELGAGTGRLTRMIAPYVDQVIAFDAAPAMLDVAAARAHELGHDNCAFSVADNAALPVDDGIADLVIAGWTVGYLVSWATDGWPDAVATVLAEMRRVAGPGARLILIETLGTGFTTPNPPEKLKPYFAMLETEGFVRTTLRTDYRFDSAGEAEALVRFFFSEALADSVAASGGATVAECTGIWTLER